MSKTILKTAIILIAMLLVLTVPAMGEEQETVENSMQEVIKQNMINRGYTPNPDEFMDVRNTEDIIATYGVMPQSGLGSYNWGLIHKITDRISEDAALEQYLGQSGGFCGGYGYGRAGIMHILVIDDFRESVTDEELMEVVEIVEKYAKEEGVNTVPIVFFVPLQYPPLDEEYQPPKYLPLPFIKFIPIAFIIIIMCGAAIFIGVSYKYLNKK
jgi:hypothetical protein